MRIEGREGKGGKSTLAVWGFGGGVFEGREPRALIGSRVRGEGRVEQFRGYDGRGGRVAGCILWWRVRVCTDNGLYKAKCVMYLCHAYERFVHV